MIKHTLPQSMQPVGVFWLFTWIYRLLSSCHFLWMQEESKRIDKATNDSLISAVFVVCFFPLLPQHPALLFIDYMWPHSLVKLHDLCKSCNKIKIKFIFKYDVFELIRWASPPSGIISVKKYSRGFCTYWVGCTWLQIDSAECLNPTNCFTLSLLPQICRICTQVCVCQTVLFWLCLSASMIILNYGDFYGAQEGGINVNYMLKICHLHVLCCSTLVWYCKADIGRLNDFAVEPHLDVSHMFYIACYTVPSWHNVVSRYESDVWCVCVCVEAASQLQYCKGLRKYSHKVGTNTSETIHKLPAQPVSAYVCSAGSMAMHACIQTQYTDQWMHKSISKPLPQAFPSYNTALIRIALDAVFNISPLLSPLALSQKNTFLFSHKATNIQPTSQDKTTVFH